MTTIPPEALSLMQESGQMSYVAINSDEPSTSQSSVLDGALKGVWEKLQHADKGRATRLAVHELGGLDWGDISMAVSLFSRIIIGIFLISMYPVSANTSIHSFSSRALEEQASFSFDNASGESHPFDG